VELLLLGLTYNQCSMMSLLTPTKLEADHAKISLFLSRKASSSTCSCWLTSAPLHRALLRTLGSRWTFLNSPSASMAFLCSVGASALRGSAKVLCCSSSSRRKCIFFWPGAKPFSMFLASRRKCTYYDASC
jgi:hypothetical protein